MASQHGEENKYKVGDYVYIEQSQENPLVIRRIDELQKTAQGNVAAKVISFYRRRDIPNSLTSLADKHANDMQEYLFSDYKFNDVEKHQLTHREVFLSRQIETVNASLIRGKCSVRILSEAENMQQYIKDPDTFYYSLVFDPKQKTLLADGGDIRIGAKHQCVNIPEVLEDPSADEKFSEELEELCWAPNRIDDLSIERFTCLFRSVGTFARALDKPSCGKMGLVEAASMASRDMTLTTAYKYIHEAGYDFAKATEKLLPNTAAATGGINVGPVFVRDEFEDWSNAEVQLFEEGMQKYQKEFLSIRDDFLPWKTLPSIVEFYYLWKTSDRCVERKKRKMTEEQQKLKFVFIPPYDKPSKMCKHENQMDEKARTRPCEGCCTFESEDKLWFPWGPERYHSWSTNIVFERLCSKCWRYWKKYGGLQLPKSTRRRIMVGTDKKLPNKTPPSVRRDQKNQKQRQQSFYLQTKASWKLMRVVCKDICYDKKIALNPFQSFKTDMEKIKAECDARLKLNPDAGIVKKRNFPNLHEEVVNKIRASQVKKEQKLTNGVEKHPSKSPKKEEAESKEEMKQEDVKDEPAEETQEQSKEEVMEAESETPMNPQENLRKGQGKHPQQLTTNRARGEEQCSFMVRPNKETKKLREKHVSLCRKFARRPTTAKDHKSELIGQIFSQPRQGESGHAELQKN